MRVPAHGIEAVLSCRGIGALDDRVAVEACRASGSVEEAAAADTRESCQPQRGEVVPSQGEGSDDTEGFRRGKRRNS